MCVWLKKKSHLKECLSIAISLSLSHIDTHIPSYRRRATAIFFPLACVSVSERQYECVCLCAKPNVHVCVRIGGPPVVTSARKARCCWFGFINFVARIYPDYSIAQLLVVVVVVVGVLLFFLRVFSFASITEYRRLLFGAGSKQRAAHGQRFT